ncbi:hypothetical protein PV334_18790 [Streptomyces sp. ME02-7008A-1]|uniref:hypothetical protein n=1 Tax=unclassified Streptomyces TaxID=2593676 RepID=UPI0029A7EF81|nr:MULTISPECIES: hypothetical protein [unclassified Streptomyces]MDX3183290.1 hypothetical protein [Streptomyces sp. ME02-7008A-1]MDX3303742.1 hypothetical protein [Streptomyces sp. ME02-7008A]
MISEPEMAGKLGAAGTREVMDGFAQDAAGGPRHRKPWLWGLGGMAMASVLWTAALSVHGPGDRRPDMHGYRLDQDPCPSLRLKSLGAAIAPRTADRDLGTGLLQHAALDRIQCYIPLRSRAGEESAEGGWSIEYTVGIAVALHKETDPGVEFEAQRRVTDIGFEPEAKLETVPVLGDKAYLLTRDEGDTELRVLEGGAVLSLSLTATTLYESDGHGDDGAGDEPDVPDPAPYQAAMISDMRDLMSSLKH